MARHPAIERVLECLPDSIKDRKAILTDCLQLLPAEDALRDRVQQCLHLLWLHEETCQQVLPLAELMNNGDAEQRSAVQRMGEQLRDSLVNRLKEATDHILSGNYTSAAIINAIQLLNELKSFKQ